MGTCACYSRPASTQVALRDERGAFGQDGRLRLAAQARRDDVTVDPIVSTTTESDSTARTDVNEPEHGTTAVTTLEYVFHWNTPRIAVLIFTVMPRCSDSCAFERDFSQASRSDSASTHTYE